MRAWSVCIPGLHVSKIHLGILRNFVVKLMLYYMSVFIYRIRKYCSLINRAAEGGRGSRTAFGFFKPRSRRLGGFLICLRFFFFSFVCDYIQTSADDVIISQL